ncbi:Hsp20/alpha crystallin family protein [Thiohalomonas denitrificans]|uniref:HSP20 family protein n=1 Tax=Thiohalomonas denitrificans TaxID=415747 RepID=A0A1G5QCU7_9GAMM|nr:Hsp20/alpha crystallin family protein [Thiohalomonas denitrificans]SCZ59715.1 HSP20 family protein [Thiohalomonas denitrificans]
MAGIISGGNGDGGIQLGPAYPPLDIIDRGDVLIVRALVPGFPRKCLDISVDVQHLFLRGRRPMKQESGAYLSHERALGNFERTVALPVPVDADHTHAHLENGVLELTLPKLEPARPLRVEVH